ncbi:MAG: hypothetical protein GY729_17950 [Desulfobacteraceae bacterium]|nr:hypothetical protein [Desulfobacteraceae bacterium]
MTQNIYKEMVLDNGLKLIISDLSRKIAEDAYVVVMNASAKIVVDKTLFSQKDLKEISFDDIANCLGDSVLYEYKAERNMILEHDKEKVFERLATVFFDNLGQYLSHPKFPKKFILKTYGDKVK